MSDNRLKLYVEDISRNNTCHRPDIVCHNPTCESCPFTEYCLCVMNTKFYPKRKKTRKVNDKD